jgi:hypothetical protein
MDVAPSSPQFRGVVLTHGGQQLGIEPIYQRERLGQHPAVDGEFELIYHPCETLDDAADLPGHDQWRTSVRIYGSTRMAQNYMPTNRQMQARR